MDVGCKELCSNSPPHRPPPGYNAMAIAQAGGNGGRQGGRGGGGLYLSRTILHAIRLTCIKTNVVFFFADTCNIFHERDAFIVELSLVSAIVDGG